MRIAVPQLSFGGALRNEIGDHVDRYARAAEHRIAELLGGPGFAQPQLAQLPVAIAISRRPQSASEMSGRLLFVLASATDQVIFRYN